jgi:ubiquinone/menaquinone biosynthesis C-methylase UbiE
VLGKEAESRKLELVSRFIPLCDNILDLAAGDGVYLPHLAGRAKLVVAVEINKDLCDVIKDRGYQPIMAHAWFLPFKNDAFDCVWASEIIEHLPTFDTFAEIERVARGNIVITMPNPWSPHYKRDPTHVLRYSLFSLARFLRHRRRGSQWRYRVRGLGFYWIPGPGMFKTLTRYATYYLPWLSPTISVIGRSTTGIQGDANAEDAP